MAPTHLIITGISAGVTFGASLTALVALDEFPLARSLATTGLVGCLLAVTYLALDGRLHRVERHADRIAQLERDQLLILQQLAGAPEDSGAHAAVRRIY